VEKECLAIVLALEKFRKYLWGVKFILHTDHKPLIYLLKHGESTRRLTRWALALQEYEFDVMHVKGEENGIADMLSRNDIAKLAEDEDRILL